MRIISIVFACLLTTTAFALEIDEKLTLRIVKTSESKKTVLINRGKEDGLEKGNHAKFYLSVGVVARGVAVKISPTRSVWALYRLVNANYIKDDQVMKLKITAPVKITKDESRTLVDDDTPSAISTDPRDLGIPLAAGAEDMDFRDPTDPRMSALTSQANFESADISSRNREIFGSLFYESRSSTTTSTSGLEFSGTDMTMQFDAGFEYYFKDESKWYSRLSLVGIFRMLQSSTLAFEGTEVQEDASFFGGGVNWYPLNRPSQVYQLIPFGQVAFMMGSIRSNYNVQDSQSATVATQELSGSVSMVTFGGGVKYFLHNGWGANLKFEYQSRIDSFAEDESSLQWEKSSSGPRLMTTLSYRF
ncbi:MAG: hypothetical protein KC478_01820 [Bacteriovoracaceae bacterium]|nr:hypothetical protein [Bacteriovoracaceae bacterium]